jgi:HEXXH motif-containing protein
MRSALADSLAHLCDAAAGIIQLPGPEIAAALSEIRVHRVSPGLFGRYYDLVFAVQDRRNDEARALFQQIVELAAEGTTFSIVPFSADKLGADTERYVRLLSLESESSVDLVAPQAAEWPSFEQNVFAALQLIEEADADLAAELRALVIQIVGAVPATGNSRGFGGASSFMLWGAILLNVRLYESRLDMIDALVHEAAHQLLFGYSLDEQLVENPIEERFGSPLRSDPRPMDGIVHATFVCARMHYAYVRLIEGTRRSLSRAEADLISERLRDYRSKFFDGLASVHRHGRMTPLGDRVMTAAADYMRSAGK